MKPAGTLPAVTVPAPVLLRLTSSSWFQSEDIRPIGSVAPLAQTMQMLCPSGLIFVPSRGGIGHAPGEFSAWPDIEKGVGLMLHALIDLSGAGV